MAEKGTHFEANVVRSAATIIEKRSKRPKGFWLGVFVRTMRSVADDIDPGCPSERSDGSPSQSDGGLADA